VQTRNGIWLRDLATLWGSKSAPEPVTCDDPFSTV
jgi:hypothetical protein